MTDEGIIAPVVPEPLSPERLLQLDLVACALRLAPGALMHHVYKAGYAPTSFNPGKGLGRFHPFEDASGRVVPVYCAANSIEGAFCETLFRGQEAGTGIKRVTTTLIDRYAHAEMTVTRALVLADLSGSVLSRMGILRQNLLDTGPAHYRSSALWARAIHHAYPDLHGLAWISRQHDRSECYLLFGDRVAPDALRQRLATPLAANGRLKAMEVARTLGVAIIG